MTSVRVPAVLKGPMRLLMAPAGPIAAWLERLVAIQAVDRGVALGALAFSALFPLMIVYAAFVPLADARNFSEHIVHQLNLSGSAAQSLRAAVAPPTAVQHSITVIGVLLVVFSTLSLARGLQRLYELSYGLTSQGMRGTPWHLLWIALIPVYLSLRPLVVELGSGWWRIVGSLLVGAVAWLITPYVLLGRRLEWRRLAPGAVLTGVSMTAFSGFSLVYLPHSVSASARKFGAIGVAFAMLSWLVIAGFVLTGSAAAGAVALEQLEGRT